jgi:hypothetical protein
LRRAHHHQRVTTMVGTLRFAHPTPQPCGAYITRHHLRCHRPRRRTIQYSEDDRD